MNKMNSKIILTVLFLLIISSLTVTATHLESLRVCDEVGGTSLFLESVSVCYDENVDGDSDELLVIVNSTDLLSRTNQRPYTDFEDEQAITFLYDEPAEGEPKVVRALLTENISTGPVEFTLGAFSLNMVSG